MLQDKRVRRHISLRRLVKGSSDKPRLSVFRSSKHIYAQIIDDGKHLTLVSSSDSKMKGSKTDKASLVGEDIAKKAKGKKVSQVVFDRGGFKYHGRVKALADGARKGGLEF